MPDRALHFNAGPTELVMRFPLHWRAITFFGILALLHSVNAAVAIWHGRIEGELSVIFATVFILLTTISTLLRTELAICRSAGEMRLRRRLGRVWSERSIAFENVHAVRLFFTEGDHCKDSMIEIICDGENIECPPTHIPRQQALCLAMTMDVELIKVCYNGPDTTNGRMTDLPRQQQPRKSEH